MASPRQVEPPTLSVTDLRSTLDDLIAHGERCRARLTAVNPETGQYRMVLQERWNPTSGRRDRRTKPADDTPFTIRDLPSLERAETEEDSLRSRIAAMLENSRSIAASLDRLDYDTGEIRIVLEGTLGGPAGGCPEGTAGQDSVTRKLKSFMSETTCVS